MNITDKLYTEWAWRTDSGVPDINNPKDKVILDSIINELNNTDGQVSKEEIIKTIKQGNFTPEQLKSILNGISAVSYKDDVLTYLSNQGKAVDGIKNNIYNELISNGDIQNFHSMLNDLPPYSSIGRSGNLFTPFKGKISPETLRYLMDQKPSSNNIATGKGEIYLSTLIRDVSSDSPEGDVSAGGQGIEVKNKGAKPAGQKLEFGVNADKALLKYIVDRVNQFLPEPFQAPAKWGKRPFHRISIIISQALEQDENATDKILQIADEATTRIFTGIDLNDLNLTNFKKANNFDADSYEREFIKRVVRAYVRDEAFKEILFLDDSSGSFIIIPADKLESLVGTKIDAAMKDGLPRWSYNF